MLREPQATLCKIMLAHWNQNHLMGPLSMNTMAKICDNSWDIRYRWEQAVVRQPQYIQYLIFTIIFLKLIIDVLLVSCLIWVQNEQQHEREMTLRHKKEFMMMRQHNEVKQMMERQVSEQHLYCHLSANIINSHSRKHKITREIEAIICSSIRCHRYGLSLYATDMGYHYVTNMVYQYISMPQTWFRFEIKVWK